MSKQLVGVMTWMVFVLILLSGTLSFGQQNSGIGKTRGDFAGFDPSDNSLILSTKHGFVTLAVDAASEISRNGEFARAEELRIGERLEVRYDRQRMVALTIRTDLGAVAGFITSLRLGMDFREQYLVAITPEAAKPVLLVLSLRTSITRDGVAVRPATLQIGDSASAVYDPDNPGRGQARSEVRRSGPDHCERRDRFGTTAQSKWTAPRAGIDSLEVRDASLQIHREQKHKNHDRWKAGNHQRLEGRTLCRRVLRSR